MNEGWDSYHKRFDMNKPRKRSFNDWMADFEKLSGKRDVSKDDLTDAQVQAAFAESYELAEAAEGRHRERFPNDPTND